MQAILQKISQILMQTLLCLIITGPLFSVSAESDFASYLTREASNNRPGDEILTSFDCSDRIFMVVDTPELEQRRYLLEVQWIDPTDRQREYTSHFFIGGNKKRVWAWLQLDPPTGAAIGQIFDPSFGMEEFIGQWQAKIKIDGDTINTIDFDVLC